MAPQKSWWEEPRTHVSPGATFAFVLINLIKSILFVSVPSLTRGSTYGKRKQFESYGFSCYYKRTGENDQSKYVQHWSINSASNNIICQPKSYFIMVSIEENSRFSKNLCWFFIFIEGKTLILIRTLTKTKLVRNLIFLVFVVGLKMPTMNVSVK